MGKKKGFFSNPLLMVACFALLNVVMYFLIKRFWIGGSSFLPMIGNLGPDKTFLLAFMTNMGVIIGAFLGAKVSGEFSLRKPKAVNIPRAVIGGVLIGMGVTLAPGTCTTAFVIGIPMLSISSFISAAGIFIGAYITYKLVWR